MPAQIQELIESADNFEIVRDKIAAILLLEQADQQAKALAALPPKDPRLWALRIFTERSNPWAEFQDTPDQIDATPIVNISVDQGTYDERASNVVERQKGEFVYNIDCYGYGVSAADGAGHIPGDAKAALESHRAFRLVRKILMSSYYTYLDLRGTVWKRFPQSFHVFQPKDDTRPTEHVVGVRLKLEVHMNEFSPQVQGETLEELNVEVKRGETGEIFFVETFVVPPPP